MLHFRLIQFNLACADPIEIFEVLIYFKLFFYQKRKIMYVLFYFFAVSIIVNVVDVIVINIPSTQTELGKMASINNGFIPSLFVIIKIKEC